MDTKKEITAMTDKKNASIAWFNAVNNATSLLDVILKYNFQSTPVHTQEDVLSLHAEIRDTILIGHNKFTTDVLSKIGKEPSQIEVDEILQKIEECKDRVSLRTLYLTTRESLRGTSVVFNAVNNKRDKLPK